MSVIMVLKLKFNCVVNYFLLSYVFLFFSCKEKKQIPFNERAETKRISNNYYRYRHPIIDQMDLFSLNGFNIDEPESKAIKIFGKPDSVCIPYYQNYLTGASGRMDNNLTDTSNPRNFKHTHYLKLKNSKFFIHFDRVNTIETQNKDFYFDKLDIKIGNDYNEIKQKLPDFIWQPTYEDTIFRNKNDNLGKNPNLSFYICYDSWMPSYGGVKFEFYNQKFCKITINGGSLGCFW